MKTERLNAHTPGPWRVSEANASIVLADNFNGPFTIAQCDHETNGVALANTRLIACAPELLAALETLITEGECYCADNVAAKGPCGWCVARDVIAKAKGP